MRVVVDYSDTMGHADAMIANATIWRYRAKR